ncbi:MAG: hypothetical protein M1834_003662 [Cirrosporium novae-zelandiae]|nr:MAG: hypothetical protein M1834_003662 [Cirrosporium novae-zelandiae]
MATRETTQSSQDITEDSPDTLEVDTSESNSTLDDDHKIHADSENDSYSFRYENGRRFHHYNNAAYHLPNDELESERLDLQHQLWLIALDGKLHLAPISQDIKTALDIATGTGIWALDFADQYPECKVIGTDLSPIQPTLNLPNCSFIVQDSHEEVWNYDHKFDFIHSRMVLFGWRDWSRYFRQAYKNLNPGGWLEIQEFSFPFECPDGSCSIEDPAIRWTQLVVEAAAKNGVNLRAFKDWGRQMQEAGFVDIHYKALRFPVNPWGKGKKAKLMGRLGLRDALNGCSGITMRPLTKFLGWTPEEVDELVEAAKEQMLDRNIHVFMPIYVLYARKPETEV